MNIRYGRLLILLTIVLIIFSFVVEAQEIELVINDQEVAADLMVVKGRTLISAQVLKKYFGEGLTWDPDDKKLRFNNRNLKIELPVGKKVAFVNSQVVPLSVRPKLINNRVMIPLRFLTKIYGGQLLWEANTKKVYYRFNQVQDIQFKGFQNASQVVIRTDHISEYELNLYHQPKRLVLDLENVGLGQIKNMIPVDDSIIKKIRVSQFQVDPAVVRVVVDVNDQLSGYQIKKEGSRLILKVENEAQIVTSSLNSNYQKTRLEAKTRQKKIVIDAGHGGKDPGAVGVSGIKEKEVNYQLAKKVAELLEKENFKVMMTRKGNKFLSLSRRAQMANNWPADIFVSIHANFNNKSWISGTATYAHWYASKDNWALAWYVQSEMIKRTGIKDNGLKAANFAVLRETHMPAILVETAFLSNPREEYLLTSNRFQNKSAEGIVAGIKKYFAKRKGTF